MVFSKNSLKNFIEDEKELEEFLGILDNLRRNFGKCSNCKSKFYSSISSDDGLLIKCEKCKEATCKKCWLKRHEDTLCEHLIKEYECFFANSSMKKVFVCRLCFSISKTIKSEQANTVKCEFCHRISCQNCFQLMDSIENHGLNLHDLNCKLCKYNDVKKDEDCQICEINGSICKQFSYRDFVTGKKK